MTGDDTTIDSICGGQPFEQPARGYRFNLDSLLLAYFSAGLYDVPPAGIVDLGAGCGLIGLLLARRFPRAKVMLVELQRPLATLARGNVARQGVADRVSVIEADLRRIDSWREPTPPALVVCNPPFYSRGSGRVNPQPQEAIARHELRCTLAELLAAASVLPAGGLLSLVHLRSRQQELIDGMASAGLSLIALRPICAYAHQPSKRILVAAQPRGARARRTVGECAPLVVRGDDGEYSGEVRRIVTGDWLPRLEGSLGR